VNESPASIPLWRRLSDDLLLAVSFLTRLPVPFCPSYVEGGLARAMRVFPLAGALVGLLGGAVFTAAHMVLPPLAAALLAVLATTLLTGALHEDGLADTADGLGARGGREKRLEVMRDSRSGAYGVLALVFTVGLRGAALAAAPSALAGLGAMMAAAAFSRACVPAVMQVLPPARADGLGAGAGTPHAGIAATALVLGGILAGAGAGLAAAPAMLVSLVVAAALTVLARRQFGGYTGDILGATQQLAEIAFILTLAGTWT